MCYIPPGVGPITKWYEHPGVLLLMLSAVAVILLKLTERLVRRRERRPDSTDGA